jgi:CheY-like chemotaxis protein
MNSIVLRETIRLSGRILFIEPDEHRANALRQIVRELDDMDVEIVRNVPAAIRSVGEHIPDLLLTSTFLPPADEATLTSHLNALPAARHLQTINVPYFIDEEEALPESSSSRVLTFLRRRPASIRPRCDVQTLRDLIQVYLSQVRTRRREADYRRNHEGSGQYSLVKQTKTHELTLARGRATDAPPAVLAGATPVPAFSNPLPGDRRRARRRTCGEVPWLWTVKLAGSSPVKVVDISSTGVLLETASRLTDGSTVDLQLLGEDTNVTIPARMLRTQVASVDGLSVKYRVAAAFAHHLALPGLQQASSAPPAPKVLADLLSRVLGNLDRCSGEAALRISFENELRRVLPVRDIQLRATPVIAERGAESVYFTVPHGSGARPILQATFEPDYAPTAMDFRLLKAAASLAAVVLEFAPR